MRRRLLLSVWALAPVARAQAPRAGSKPIRAVEFPDGKGVARPIHGRVGPARRHGSLLASGSERYTLAGSAGQKIGITLSSANGHARFSLQRIIGAAQSFEPVATAVEAWAGVLVHGGDYAVTVFMPAGKPAADFTLRITRQ